MPKIGDVVLYTSMGRTVNALVLALRNGEIEHLGSDGEPLLSLAFLDPARETAITKNQIGYIPTVFIEHDVVHASHEFSAQFKKDKGISTAAQIAAQRGHGEWEEVQLLDFRPASAAELAGMQQVEAIRDQVGPCIPGTIRYTSSTGQSVPEDVERPTDSDPQE